MPRRPRHPQIIGQSTALRGALRAAERVAPTSAAVLIQGESGTGKELFARHVHAASGRDGAFVALNCAALPEALVESQLFGHRRGAFTGASSAQDGFVVAADGGTLFLDEVGELPLPVQAKLLRVLQERTVVKVGDTHERKVNLRVISASHSDLRELIRRGRFRDDLFHRLARFELVLPPLRDRGRDAVLIARAMLKSGMDGVPRCRLSRRAEAVLVGHRWPGNVRELGNVLFRAALTAPDGVVTAPALAAALGALVGAREVSVSERVLDLVRERGSVSSGDLAHALAMPKSSLKRLLAGLVDAGELARTGRGKATRYCIPPEAKGPALDPREAVVMELLERDGRVTRRSLVEAGELPARTAGRVLAGMVERGLLVPDGRQGRSKGYVRAG